MIEIRPHLAGDAQDLERFGLDVVTPGFQGQPDLIHWSIPDPARAGASDEESYPAFERTADELAARAFLLELIEHNLSPPRR